MKNSFSRRSRIGLLAGGSLFTMALLVQGCLQRPAIKQKPNTSNVFVEQIENNSIKTIDMLFVIDNSVSMGDKQEILKVAVPKMVERLITPNCLNDEGDALVDDQGNVVKSTLQADPTKPPTCPPGGKLEFVPVNDIHIGVISSSLGSHGSPSDPDPCPRESRVGDEGTHYEDDQGHLIPTVRTGVDKGPSGLGFLAWSGGDEGAQDALNTAFIAQVSAVGELGCGFEATLESWYRFLVDPSPPERIVLTNGSGSPSDAERDDAGNIIIDTDILAQRAEFLRPDGLVAIIVLTDENDCSMMDGGQYYSNVGFGYLLASSPVIAGLTDQMPVATAICATNPNDACCLSCLQAKNPSAACAAQVQAACPDPDNPPQIEAEVDDRNVRCFDNKHRFGVDLLYPIERYLQGLSSPEIVDARTGMTTNNPLLRSASGSRPKDLVFFAGIVGVPWQDIATPESLDPDNKDTMRYLNATELKEEDLDVGGTKVNRWKVILGEPNLPMSTPACRDTANPNPACGAAPLQPLDPFMIEQIEPRMAGMVHPIVTSEAIVGMDSTDPQANVINGHEYNTAIPDQGVHNDLQYACTFELFPGKTAEACEASYSCDCKAEGDAATGRNRPLCQPRGGGPAGKAQYWGKAYPGTRFLSLMRDFGTNSIVGSICPKVVDDSNKPDYGYNPAVQAIVDRLAEKLDGACLPRELSLNSEGKVPCSVVEAKRVDVTDPNSVPLDCTAPGRGEVTDEVRDSVINQLAGSKVCSDGKTQSGSDIDCDQFKMCEIRPFETVEAENDCLYNTAPTESLLNAGFCYIDPAKQSENGDYVAGGSREAAIAAGAQYEATVPQDGTNLIVADCAATQRRLLRLVGQNTPAQDSYTLVACSGDAVGVDKPIPIAPVAVAPDPAN